MAPSHTLSICTGIALSWFPQWNSPNWDRNTERAKPVAVAALLALPHHWKSTWRRSYLPNTNIPTFSQYCGMLIVAMALKLDKNHLIPCWHVHILLSHTEPATAPFAAEWLIWEEGKLQCAPVPVQPFRDKDRKCSPGSWPCLCSSVHVLHNHLLHLVQRLWAGLFSLHMEQL